MRRLVHGVTIVLMLFGSSVLATAAQDATPQASPVGGQASLLADLGYPTLEVTTTDGTDHDLPAELEAGRYHVVLSNESELDVDLEFFQLPEGFTIDDLQAFFDEAAAAEGPEFTVPDEYFDISFNGGPTAFAGASGEVILDLTPGEWVVNVYSYDEETETDTNTPTIINVTGEMPAVEEPTDVVEISMVEMAFEVSAPIVAGPQLWRTSSDGEQPHHLVLVSVPDGTTEEQILELAASFGPPATPGASPVAAASPAAPALSFEDVQDIFYTLILSNGQFNLNALDLDPGTYAMLCFLPAPDGTPHIFMGMLEVFVVE